MLPLAALLVLCSLLVTLCYAGFCFVSRWGTCNRCRPGGKNRTCRACNGTGIRPRIGWQIYTHLRRAYRDGTR